MNLTLQKGLSKVIHLSPAEKRVLIDKYREKVFDGNKLAHKIRGVLRERILAKTSNSLQSKPCLGYIIVGDLPQSDLYVKLKLKACDEVGIGHHGFRLPASTTEEVLVDKVKELQND